MGKLSRRQSVPHRSSQYKRYLSALILIRRSPDTPGADIHGTQTLSISSATTGFSRSVILETRRHIFGGTRIESKRIHSRQMRIRKLLSTTTNTQNRRVLTLANPTQGAYYASMPTTNDGANASYNGLLTSLQHRLRNNFSLRANYTWSYCISESDFNIELTGPTYMNPDDLAQDRGNCNLDTRHVFNGTVIATSRYNGSRSLRLLLSGWRIASLLRISSGASINVTTGTDNSLTGANLDRPNLINPTIAYKSGVQCICGEHFRNVRQPSKKCLQRPRVLRPRCLCQSNIRATRNLES